MQDVILVLLGLGVGTVGTLIGAGGGFILVPVLLFMYPHMNPENITSISLAIVFMNAASGSIAYARMKRIDYKSAALFALATLPGGFAGTILTAYIPRNIFDMLLGCLLVIISVYLFINPNKKVASHLEIMGHSHRIINDSHGVRHEYSFNLWIGIIISFFVGFLASLLGIGGGVIHVPALTSILNFPIHIASATSHAILAIMALEVTILHIIHGDFKGLWLITIELGIGVIAGAQLGARLSNKMQPHWIVRALAIALLLVGVRLVMKV
jgi:uncharacterized membrane protein YfcA